MICQTNFLGTSFQNQQVLGNSQKTRLTVQYKFDVVSLSK